MAGQVAAALDDPGEPAVVEVDRVLLAALAAELEPDASIRSTSTWRSRSVVRPNELFCSRVLVVADADQRLLEQLDDRREHLLARQAGQRAGRARSRARICGSASPNAIIRSYLVSSRTSRQRGVIAVLLAPARVAAGRLEVAVAASGRSRRRSTPAGSPACGCASRVSSSVMSVPSGARNTQPSVPISRRIPGSVRHVSQPRRACGFRRVHRCRRLMTAELCTYRPDQHAPCHSHRAGTPSRSFDENRASPGGTRRVEWPQTTLGSAISSPP